MPDPAAPPPAPDELDDGVFVPIFGNDYSAYDEFIVASHDADAALDDDLQGNLADHRDKANDVVLGLLEMRNRTIREEFDDVYMAAGLQIVSIQFQGEPIPIHHYRVEPA